MKKESAVLIIGLLAIIAGLLFLSSCARKTVEPPKGEPGIALPAAEEDTEAAGEAVGENPEELATRLCNVTADCDGLQCINGQCGSLESLYRSDCASLCEVQEATFSTSDGESYTLSPGQGSYTAAGAVEWKLQSMPRYCQPEGGVPLPLKIIMKNRGQVVGEYLLTMQEGESSETITHPAISSIAFSVTAEEVVEECS